MDSSPSSIAHPARSQFSLRLSIAALGVVFGDIGTSPLYALRECFGGSSATPNYPAIMGILSMIFWTLLLTVSAKYVMIVMRISNKGEGGILALTALVLQASRRNTKRKVSVIVTLGILGAALLYSDGIITPAISVLSAVEGLSEITPFFTPYVAPISILILAVLFLVQSKGTYKVGALFGPMLLVWFLVLGILGIANIIQHPSILWALNPYWAVLFLWTNKLHSMIILGAVFLTVTGAEVLYADMGHFGRKPITFAWVVLVLPCLLLNYFGQGALLLGTDGAIGNVFFRLAPHWFEVPLVILATIATVIASQAVISAAFSLARQSVQLGFWPRLLVKHTSSDTIGQVYVPSMNWLLMIGTFVLILAFRESGKLAAAYGIAVSATMVITTILLIILLSAKKKRLLIVPLLFLFLPIDLAFFTSNLLKIASGGWVVIGISTVIFTLMITWIQGRREMAKIISSESMDLDVFVKSLAIDPPHRVNGTAVFLSDSLKGVPRSLMHNLKHNQILHKHIVILSVVTEDIPTVLASDRISCKALGAGIFAITLHFGFCESANVPVALSKVDVPELDFHPMKTTYFLGRDTMIVSPTRKSLPLWMRHIYIYLVRNSLNATAFFSLPHNRVVELGHQNQL